MPDSKSVWIEITLTNGFKFFVEKTQFMGNYANLVGNHVTRLGAYNNAYFIVQPGAEVIKVKKVQDDSFYINFNQTVMAQKVTKQVEVLE
jgi:hypothetical protein